MAALFAYSEEASPIEVTHTQNTRTIPLYEVFEITFKHNQRYANPFFDVAIDVTFQSPSGKKITVGGFHYGSAKRPDVRVQMVETPKGRRREVKYIFKEQNLWKARFAPSELGLWQYTFVFSNLRGEKATGKGSFTCVKGRRPAHGFVRPHPTNPFRWVFDDGTPYFPIGLQDCWGDGSANGSVLDGRPMEGPFRPDRRDLVELPEGPLYVRGPSMDPQNADVYFRRYGQCGFNLFRYSQHNCSFDLYQDLDHYLVQEAVMVDEMLQYARKYNFRIFYGFFGFLKVYNHEPDNAEAMAKLKRFVKYSVDRWGAYVDFWQFLNEQKADDRWYEIMIPYLKSIDPYHHPVTTSWERPELAGIDVSAPHWYQRYDPKNELVSDEDTASRAIEWKKHGKPVIVGEHGNHTPSKEPRPVGVGGVWDAGSAQRMRIRNWTAFFHEIAFIFWNTSYARDGHYMNMWLGPQEREYVRAMQDFVYRLDGEVKMVPVEVSLPDQVRAYGLASKERAGVYFHHFNNHSNPVEGFTLTLDVPAASRGYWYSPETAAILGTFEAPTGRQTFKTPPFVVDLALLITPDGPPDIDNDGLPNHLDPDDDNDQVPDTQDAFPLEPEEWEDADGDLIGDNMDADINGDGVGDDRNGNGTPDHKELDFDRDGVPRAHTIPWDAFPLDPKEWRDTDGDEIGDNADQDDDNDGWSDAEEKEAKTDPKDKLNFPHE
ncbi:MAG: hypothetical protein AMS15_05490 [Planctomycetes bacterium DG_23]|nr:MAG: hypothetical protein AMS15_05490 [Planctomycetes bacterium DG_23]